MRAVPVVNSSGVITGYVNPDAGNAPIDPLTAEFIVNPTFSPTLAGSIPRTGNLGRNTERSPGINNWDMTIQKSTRLSETVRVEFRAEFFNVFNQVNFDIPNRAVNNQSTLGRITRTDPSSGDPRILQFGLKLVF